MNSILSLISILLLQFHHFCATWPSSTIPAPFLRSLLSFPPSCCVLRCRSKKIVAPFPKHPPFLSPQLHLTSRPSSNYSLHRPSQKSSARWRNDCPNVDAWVLICAPLRDLRFFFISHVLSARASTANGRVRIAFSPPRDLASRARRASISPQHSARIRRRRSALVAPFCPSALSRKMSGLADPQSSRNAFTGASDVPGQTRNLPVLPSSAQHSTSAMEITPPSSVSAGGALVHSSPNGDRSGAINTNGSEVGNTSNPPNQAVGAAAAAQQPKVVQTAFIHKLYKCASCPSFSIGRY